MKKQKAKTKQNELGDILENAYIDNPALREAMDVFQLTQAQYSLALAGMTTVKIITSNTTNPGGNSNAIVDKH